MTTDLAFSSLADLLPEWMLLVSVSGSIRACNTALATGLGWRKRELVGRPLADLISDCDLDSYLRRCAASRQMVLGAMTFRRADGTRVTCRSEGARYESDGDAMSVLLRLTRRELSVARFVALTQRVGDLTSEIARRRRVEAVLTEQREWLRVTLSSIGDAVIATDADGRVVFMNVIAERLTGWTEAESTGRPVGDIFRIVNEDTRLPVVNPVTTALTQGRTVGLANHTVLIAKDGTERAIDDSGSPIIASGGRVLGVVLVFRDVSDARMAQREQRAAHEAAEAANRAKDEFMAMLGHELRNPLAPIVTALELARLKNTPLTREFDVIKRQVAHLLRLVDDLLDVARVTRGKIGLRREIADIGQLLGRAMETAAPLIESGGHRVDVSVEPGLLVDADPTRLSQVFANLLTNAAKYTPPGGQIQVAATRAGEFAIVTVRDTGIGIPAELQARVFDLFVQGTRARDRHEGGLGIGLALVKNLVALHGGDVSVQSDGPGTGSTFTVRLPLAMAASAHAPLQEAGPRAGVADMRVMVVDDNREAADLVGDLLRLAGCRVTVCVDSATALQSTEHTRPDVMVLDIGLPVMDGYELAAILRGRLGSQAPRIIALTGYGQEHDRARSAAAGFVAHLVKPVDNEALLDAVAAAAHRVDDER